MDPKLVIGLDRPIPVGLFWLESLTISLLASRSVSGGPLFARLGRARGGKKTFRIVVFLRKNRQAIKCSSISAPPHLFEFMPSSRNPLAKGLLSIFSLVICKSKCNNHESLAKDLSAHLPNMNMCYERQTLVFWYAVTAVKEVSGNVNVWNTLHRTL